MRILVLSGGARGDTQPYAALARGFSAAGHPTRFAVMPEFVHLLDGSGVEPIVSEFDARKMLESEEAKEMFGAGKNPLRFLSNFSRILEPILERGVADLVRYCRDSDALVLASTSIMTGTRGMERLGIPFCSALPFPVTSSAYQASVMAPELPRWVPLRGLYNRLTHWAPDLMMYRLLGRHHHRMLRKLPPPPRAAPMPAPILYGYSPSVAPRPPDWPPHVEVTGYWFLDSPADYRPPPELAAFLAAGPAPVYVGFGSMNDRDPKGATELVCEALARAGCRGVLVTGWGALTADDLPKHVRALKAVPHDWLFPRMAAVVHHCGAGTTSAALRAGVPGVGVPHFADQFFWARRVYELGVGPRAIPRKKLTVDSLAQALRLATGDAHMREAAVALGEKIRAENGVGRAVESALRHFQR